MGMFETAKENHRFHGHGVFCVLYAIDYEKSFTFIQNICKDLRCDEVIPHAWVATVHKGNPAMKCNLCGFLWQTHMNQPRVTCDQILSNPKKRN